MPKGWDASVYRMDVDNEEYMGFFIDEAAANDWIKKQKQGTYEVRPPGGKA